VHQELHHWSVQVNANSTGDKVEEGADSAVNRGSPDQFNSGDRNCIPLHGDCLDIGAGEGTVDFVPEL